jgi:hypothetical protein
MSRTAKGIGLMLALVIVTAAIGGKTLALAAIAGMLGAWIFGRYTRLVAAQEFRLVDDDGRRRASLALTPEGEAPGIDVYYRSGQRAATFGTTPEGTVAVGLYGYEGKSRIGLALAPDGPLGLFLGVEGGKPAAEASLSPEGDWRLTVVDKAGTILFKFPR